MEIVEGTIKYHPPLPYRQFNLHLLFGWVLFYHKDAGRLDVQLYNSERQVTLIRWCKYNTIYGMAWIATIFGVVFKSGIAKKAWSQKE